LAVAEDTPARQNASELAFALAYSYLCTIKYKSYAMKLFDALIAFVQRNPLFVLLVVVLAVAAPALLRGIAAFVLYLLLGFFLLFGVLALLLRWRLYRVQRDMESRLGRDSRQEGFGGNPYARRPRREGDVKVRKTSRTPEKRVANNVGDYVDFEETKEEPGEGGRP